MEYEEHLRNTLEKDSESFSLHTFEALLSRSMENLGKSAKSPPLFQQSGDNFRNSIQFEGALVIWVHIVV